jgi:hypothetical protein
MSSGGGATAAPASEALSTSAGVRDAEDLALPPDIELLGGDDGGGNATTLASSRSAVKEVGWAWGSLLPYPSAVTSAQPCQAQPIVENSMP